MSRLGYVFFVLAVLLGAGSCTSEAPEDVAEDGKWLYVGKPILGWPLRYGDVIKAEGEYLRLTSVLTSRDTVVEPDGASWIDSLASGASFLRLQPPVGAGALTDLTHQPFVYGMDGLQYWSSFEPAFTGFPEYARPGARDFVNHLFDWSATTPGLQYSEYTIPVTDPQPVLVLAERNRSTYLDNLIVVVDAVSGRGFRGRVIREGVLDSIEFTKVDLLRSGFTPKQFVDLVNEGYSRSFLLIPRSKTGEGDGVVDAKRLPRRSLIDPGDLGNISASFLDDGTVMFLSNDHIVLQGSYVLDLDKGLLTVSDDTDASYRVFVDLSDRISFTLPVSVVELDGSRLRGEDNYLRIEVVE
ncbi:hypothetical protein GGR28_001140 [Lewinella aquimaris]|uniref:Uncharacterized protein n=1 Tax=Neolewinella aquimaris TaxID=1835722 RepID=A0A840E5S8_9BACT|nr:hypothetical protein [Neolewinella aquimaris]MBB4078527.1 hypothetical protein [Neolewinella aquimaris]